MSAIFISHSSKDNTIASDVKEKLLEQGHRSVFLDYDPEDGIPAGRNWERELYTRLHGCQAVIVLCSEHSMASQWCFVEIAQARSLGKHLFPLKVADCQISSLLSDVQVTDLTLNPIEGYQRLWSGLKKVGLDPADLFDWDGTRPPYPGLLAFQEQDAAVYFGRDAAIQGTMETLNRLQRLGGTRLVLVLGASGSGKSSLVRAGMTPRLKRDKDRWLVLEPFRPLGRTFDELAMVLANAFASFGNARDWKSIRDALNPAGDNAGSVHLLDLANDLRVAAGRREATVLLVVDQFEELLGQDTDQSSSLFLRLLKAVLIQPNSPYLAVATLRSDFLSVFQIHEVIQDLPYEPLPLPQMALADFAQVIEGPAKVAGIELEAGLTQAMVADTATDDALPLLAFTLRELWDRYGGNGRLSFEEYRDRLGRLQGSLERTAEALFAERGLSAHEELHLRKAFLSMVRVDEEGRYIRKPAGWTELPADIHDLLERFVQARLLVSRGEGTERLLEVAHEALFRSWDRLVAWLNADREFLLWRQRLRGDIAEWERNEHDESTLLRGPALTEAERWLGERPDDLNSAESGFIEASVALREQERTARERLRRRNRLIALGVISILSIAVLSVAWQWQQAEKQRNRAEAQQLAAQADLVFAEGAGYLERSTLLAIESMRRIPLFENVSALRRALSLLPRPIARLPHESKVWAVAFSPDGRYLATGSDDETARVFEAATGKELARLTHEQWVSAIAFSPDGRTVATGSEDGTARVFEATTGRELARIPHKGKVWAVDFSPDGRTMATGSAEGTVQLFEAATGRELARLARDEVVWAIAFSPDGGAVATGSEDGTVRVLEIATGRELAHLTNEDRVVDLAFSPDGRYLATGGGMGTARVFEIGTGRELARLTHEDAVTDVAFSSDGRAVATGSEDGTARVFEAATGRELARLAHEGIVWAVAFSPDGRYVATGSADQTARVFEATTGRELVRLPPEAERARLRFPFGNSVRAVAFSPHGRAVAAGSEDGTVRLFEAKAGRELARLTHEGALAVVAFSPDGKLVATASHGGTVQLFEAATGRERVRLAEEGSWSWVSSLTFSPDGRYVVAAGGAARVFEVTTGRELARFPYDFREILGFAFSSDGRYLATASADDIALVIETASGREFARLAHEGTFSAFAFSPDGRYLATGSWETDNVGRRTAKTVRIFEVATGRELASLTYEAGGSALAFSPDSRYLATEGNGTVRVLEVMTGQERAGLTHRGGSALIFSPDGRYLATGGADKTTRVFEVATGWELARLTHEEWVSPVAFSPDSRYLQTEGKNGIVRVLEVTTGRELARLTYGDAVKDVAFSPDGRCLDTASSSSGSEEILLYRHLLRPEDLIAEACSRLSRNLTREEWVQYVGDAPYQKTCPGLPGPDKKE